MRCIFPTIVLSCYLNPSLDFYFSCFYALSSQTDGKLSEDRDYVLRFLWIPDAPKQSRKEQVLGQNRLLWFRLQRPDLVHTGCQERREKKNKRAGFVRYPTENSRKGALALSRVPHCCLGCVAHKHHPLSHEGLDHSFLPRRQ